MEFILQSKDLSKSKTLNQSIRNVIKKKGYKRISVCSAYATRQGVLHIRSIAKALNELEYRWLFGLDDFITEPAAIKMAMKTSQSEIRVVKMMPKARFHAKVYLLDRNTKNSATILIGSNNLTGAGLNNNCVAFVVIHSGKGRSKQKMVSFWNSLWKIGKKITVEELKEYEKKHKKKRQKNPTVTAESAVNLKNHKLRNASMLTSSLMWIELGRNTGNGNQLEVVKDLAPFLGFPPNPSVGDSVNLPMKSIQGIKIYRVSFVKGMWRFMSFQQGFSAPLRPDLSKPSPYSLVIERKNSNQILEAKIVRNMSGEMNRLRLDSKQFGFIGSSIPGPYGRKYGWL